ncbi:MAG: hypothetical protein FJ356_01995 [Thaumarchaeota archaeon]|nr:hypothetical protein [Nitrososphaerota archaeon]
MNTIFKHLKKVFLLWKTDKLENEIKYDRAYIKVLNELPNISPKQEAMREYLRGKVSSMQNDFEQSCKELRELGVDYG